MPTVDLGPCDCCGERVTQALGCAVCEFTAEVDGYTVTQRTSVNGAGAELGPQNPLSFAVSDVITVYLQIALRQGGTSFFPAAPRVFTNSPSPPTCRFDLDYYVSFSRFRSDTSIGSYSYNWGFRWDNLAGVSVYEISAAGTLDDGSQASAVPFPSISVTAGSLTIQKCCKNTGCDTGQPGSLCDGIAVWDCDCCENGAFVGNCLPCDNPLP